MDIYNHDDYAVKGKTTSKTVAVGWWRQILESGTGVSVTGDIFASSHMHGIRTKQKPNRNKIS